MMIALPNVGQIGSQMRASEAIRTLESDLSEFRAESIRLRAASSITFSSSGYTWDIYNDGTIDAERVFAKNVSWTGATPSSLSFNGLGLARGLITTKQLSLTSSGSTLKLSVNRNGHIDIS